MVSLDSWADIRDSRSQGLSIRAIAAEGCAKKTEERALASDSPPSYMRRIGGENVFSKLEPLGCALLAERVGWQGSGSRFEPSWVLYLDGGY